MAKLLSGTRIYGTATVDTQVLVNGGLPTNSTVTGSLQIVGGAGISGGLFVGGTVTATTFVGAFSGSITGAATQVNTVLQTASASYYPTFVNANNASATGMSVYTTSSFYINPANGAVQHNGNVSLGQPNQLGFANGQYIKDNGGGGFVMSSGAAFQLIASATGGITMGTAAYAQQSGALLSVNGGVYVNGTVTATTFIGALTGVATTATNIAGGTPGLIPIQSAAGVTAFIGTGTVGQLLQMQTGNTATWVSTGSLVAGIATTATQIYTVLQTANASYYPAFVSANNASATGMSVYTTSSFYINPLTGKVIVTAPDIDGGLTLLSGAAGSQTSFGVGRTAREASFAIAGSASNYMTGTAAGDAILMNRGGNLFLGMDSGYAVKILTGNVERLRIDSTGVTYIYTSTNATSTATGALTVAGGVGIGRDMWIGGTATHLSTLASTSSVSQNALYVVGGVGIGASLYVTGPAVFNNNVTFAGTATYVYTTNTVYTDNIIELHYPSTGTVWTVSDGKDIGLRFHYYSGADQNAFLGRANDTGYLEWYGNGVEDTTSTFTASTYGVFKTGGIVLAYSTSSNSTNTGALTVSGGVGIGGSVYVGSTVTSVGLFTPNGYTQKPVGSYDIATSQRIHAGQSINIGVGSGGNITFGDGFTPSTISGTPSTISAYVNNNSSANQLWYGNSSGLIVGNGTGPTATLDVRGTVYSNEYLMSTSSSQQLSGAKIQRVYSTSAAAGSIYPLGTWYDTEGTVALEIQVSSETSGNSGTATYRWQGGYASVASTGTYYRLFPFNEGRGHGDGADSGLNLNAWGVYVYSTDAQYTYGIAVSVPAGRTAKTLVTTVSELKRGMTYTAGFNTATTVWTTGTSVYSHKNLIVENLVTATTGYFNGTVTANSFVGAFSGAVTGASTQVQTTLQTGNASYFPTFVDTNNASATGELVYTTSSFSINPMTGYVGIGGGTIGSILSTEENTTSATEHRITNSNTGSNTTKSSRLTFRITDTVGTRKDVAYISAIPINADSSNGDHLTFSTRTADATPTEKVRIDNNGVVGIGYTSVQVGEKLGVLGGVYVSGTVTATTFVGAFTGAVTGTASNASQVNTILQTASASYFPTFVDTNNATATAETVYTTSSFTINPQSGNLNVGIFTTSIAKKLTVVGEGNFSDASNNTRLYMGFGTVPATGGTGAYVYNSDNSPLVFGTSNTERMRIDASGNVILGYNTAATQNVYRMFATAHTATNRGAIVSFGMIDGGGIAGMAVYNTTATNTSFNAQYVAFTTHEGGGSTGERMRIDSNGRVSIGANAASTWSTTYSVLELNNHGTIYGGSASLGLASNMFYDGVNWQLKTANSSTLVALSSGPGNVIFYRAATGAIGSTAALLESMRITYNGGISFGISGTAYGTSGYVLKSNGDAAPTWVNPTSLASASATNADNLATIIATANATYYPSFVDSNNATAAYETHYTTSSFVINPATGFVTIGGASASGGKLGIAGVASSQTTLFLQNPGIGSGHIGFNASTSNLKLYNCYGTGLLADGFGIDIGTTGNVGIGTASPTVKLDIAGTGTAVTQLIWARGNADSAFVSSLRTGDAGTSAAQGTIGVDYAGYTDFARIKFYRASTTGEIHFYTGGLGANGTEKMRLMDSGNLGIGTTAPAQKLHVVSATNYQGILVSGSAAPTIGFVQNAGTVQTWKAGISGLDGTAFSIGQGTGGTDSIIITTGNNVGIGTTTPGYKLEVNGSFAATTKSFVINHPTRPGMKLRYGSLEGPENGIYVRGKLTGTNTIELPEYWTKLVDPDSITVSLTSIGKHQDLYVADISNNVVIVGNGNILSKAINCFYVVYGERADVEKLVVEI